MKKFLFLTLLLTGCATTPKKSVNATATQHHDVPVLIIWAGHDGITVSNMEDDNIAPGYSISCNVYVPEQNEHVLIEGTLINKEEPLTIMASSIVGPMSLELDGPYEPTFCLIDGRQLESRWEGHSL